MQHSICTYTATPVYLERMSMNFGAQYISSLTQSMLKKMFCPHLFTAMYASELTPVMVDERLVGV